MLYSFNTLYAQRYGVGESILLHNFQYWIRYNRGNEKNFHDGNWWTFNSVKSFSEMFPFWSNDKIRRLIKSLINQNVLLTGNYNKKGYDRTIWYAINPDLHAEMEINPLNPKGINILQDCKMDVAEVPNAFGETAEPIPDSKQDSKLHIKAICELGSATYFEQPIIEDKLSKYTSDELKLILDIAEKLQRGQIEKGLNQFGLKKLVDNATRQYKLSGSQKTNDYYFGDK